MFHQHHLLNLHTQSGALQLDQKASDKDDTSLSQANIKLNTTKEKTNKLDWAERGNMYLLNSTVHYAKCWKHGTPMTYQGAEESNDRVEMHLCWLHFKKGRWRSESRATDNIAEYFWVHRKKMKASTNKYMANKKMKNNFEIFFFFK